jgi:hypothetical protein
MIAEIWAAQDLGPVKHIKQAPGGMVNACDMLNEDLVVRYNVWDPHFAKIWNESRAYRLLKGSAIPVPEVEAFSDPSQTLA